MRQDLVWKGAATAASIAAGLAARKIAVALWRRQRGGDPPANPADPTTSWGEAVTWTAVVGVAVGVARLLARRGAAGAWRAVEGKLPPDLEEVEA